ncbi:DUF6624 domain-containing protein [Sphingobium sp. TCM1]|uniref:DUF6624 domain-containing protein n=1 Tax=Sphingobium sp. TCM1 TaxID=453246 RepID=UPI0018DEAEEF|nr:DUF6624 domain-containing protein [Sphingobium sp. TCM1]
MGNEGLAAVDTPSRSSDCEENFCFMEHFYNSDPLRIKRELEERKKIATENAIRSLRSSDISVTDLKPGCYADSECVRLMYADRIYDIYPSWAELQSDNSVINLYFKGYMDAVEGLEATFPADRKLKTDSYLDRLVAPEQILRNLFGKGDLSAETGLTPKQVKLIRTKLFLEIDKRDAKNRTELDDLIKRVGFPKQSEFGFDAVKNAFLVVQHSSDIEYQYKKLLDIEKNVKIGEFPERLYALLFDRVQLALTGKQRYGTQFLCRAGKYVVAPLESPGTVDEIRSKAGLGSLSQYAAQLPPGC